MNIKAIFPWVCTLVLMGFTQVKPLFPETPSAEAGSATPSAPAASSPPPITSFSVMSRRAPAPPPAVRPAEPPISSSPPAPSPPPRAEPQPSPPPQTSKVAPAAETPKPAPVPPEPPQSLRVSEPKPPPAPAREPVPLPVNPLPELPARTSSSIWEFNEEPVSYSRTVKAFVGQLVEIPFRGSGWVYIGEQKSRQGISYDSRRLEKEGQTFIFRAEIPETYVLKFYKQDFIEDYILNDYVQVIVNENPGGMNRFLPVSAEPRWPPLPGKTEPAPPPAAASPPPPPALAPESNPPAVPDPPAPAPVPVDYLQQAKEAYAAGQFPQALSLLDQFREQYPGGSDEAWWLYGQSFEANSPRRDIRSAVDYYRRLLREYPQSAYTPQAQRRISFLERYYFTIQ